MAELIWGAAGVLIVVFMGYAAAHTWLLRRLVERAMPGFPFLDSVLGGHRGMSRREYREWYREYWGEDPE